jgi:hypothetical protein
MGAVQHTENTLIEVAIGEAKYEHVYRALVWRIPRLVSFFQFVSSLKLFSPKRIIKPTNRIYSNVASNFPLLI